MATIPEIAKRLGRHAVNAGLAASQAVEEGYAAARKPFEEPGAEMHQAEPFAPGTVSGGAIVAKTVRNILAGSRQAANDRLLREQRATAMQTGELERSRLRQQIEASTLQDYTDPASGETYKLTGADIRAIKSRQFSRAPATVRPAPNVDLSSRLERARKALDDRVARETEDDFQQRAAPLLTDIRRRAMLGDMSALDVLGLPRSLADQLKSPAAWQVSALVDKALVGRSTAYRNEIATRVRARYAQHYGAIERAMQESGGLTQGATPSADQGDPLLDEVMRRLDEEEAAPEEP